jgi:hypothetical protein
METLQKQPPKESNKIATAVYQIEVDQENELDISDLITSLKDIKKEEQELLSKRKELQTLESKLRNQAAEEFGEKKRVIEGLKSEIIFLQKKCNDLEQALGIASPL